MAYYRPLSEEGHEIRLISIAPLEENQDDSEPLRCQIFYQKVPNKDYTLGDVIDTDDSDFGSDDDEDEEPDEKTDEDREDLNSDQNYDVDYEGVSERFDDEDAKSEECNFKRPCLRTNAKFKSHEGDILSG